MGTYLLVRPLAENPVNTKLVPSFAVGRTQTILWYMQRFIQDKKIPAIPIFVDSPMGVEVTRITTDHSDLYDEETKKLLDETTTHSVVFATSSAQRAPTTMGGRWVVMRFQAATSSS